jgi:hypothetical protein
LKSSLISAVFDRILSIRPKNCFGGFTWTVTEVEQKQYAVSKMVIELHYFHQNMKA